MIFWTWITNCSRIGISGPILMILVPNPTISRSPSPNLVRKVSFFYSFISYLHLQFGHFGCFGPFSGTNILMKELKILHFLIKIELSDLKLVDIGTKIIKIGQEVPILV